MKQTELTKAVNEVVALKMAAIDRIVEELIDPVANVGNPERLLGKPYEMWQPQDFILLSKIYGQGDNTPLASLIFRKSYQNVLEGEKEVGSGRK